MTSPFERPIAREESWLSLTLRVVVHAAAAGVFAWPLTVTEGVVAAALGGAAGAVGGRLIARSRLRMPAIVGIAAAVFAAALVLGSVATGAEWLSAWLGPATALRLGDGLVLGVGALAVSLGLRAASARRPGFAVLEVAVIGVAFAQLVVAHRQGAINRPFELADPILSRGGDPTLAILAVGAAATTVIVLLLLSERSLLRSVLHLAVAALVLLLILGTTAMMGLPTPEAADGLGLRGESEEERDRRERQEQEQREGRGGRRSNDELDFRDNYQSAANKVPVAVVLLRDDYSPPTGMYYFRQGAFSQYNGRRLVAATRPDVDEDIAATFPNATVEVRGAPRAGDMRAPLETTVALLADHTRPFGLEAPVRFKPARNPNPGRFRRMYTVESASLTADAMALLGTRAGGADWSAEELAHYTAAPADPRYGALARQIVGELPEWLRDDPMARALAISDWLGEEGTYSLRSRHADAEDPTAHFLFGDKTGYCVHFAHAAAYLMRSVGVPARVATGYAVDEASRQGGSAILITGEASHAWPEVYVEGAGWVIVDVAPQRVLDPPPSPPDADLQQLLGEMARGETPVPIEGRPPIPPLRQMVREGGQQLGLGIGALILAVLFVLYAVKIWRRASPLWASPRALPRVAYRAELDRLAENAMRREWGESREAFAARLKAQVPSFTALTRANVAARFARRAPGREQVKRAAREVRRDLRRVVPWWKRAAGAITPWSWIRSR